MRKILEYFYPQLAELNQLRTNVEYLQIRHDELKRQNDKLRAEQKEVRIVEKPAKLETDALLALEVIKSLKLLIQEKPKNEVLRNQLALLQRQQSSQQAPFYGDSNIFGNMFG